MEIDPRFSCFPLTDFPIFFSCLFCGGFGGLPSTKFSQVYKAGSENSVRGPPPRHRRTSCSQGCRQIAAGTEANA
eukprot:1204390-Amphidinium_carterae.1